MEAPSIYSKYEDMGLVIIGLVGDTVVFGRRKVIEGRERGVGGVMGSGPFLGICMNRVYPP
jgi:hypothetical protein